MHPGNVAELDYIRRAAPVAQIGNADAPTITKRGNLCPFGCTTEQLDNHGLCVHFEGVTDGRKDPATQRVLYERSRKVHGRWVTGEQREEATDADHGAGAFFQ